MTDLSPLTYSDEVALVMAKMADLLLSETPNWNMLDRIRRAMDEDHGPLYGGPYHFSSSSSEDLLKKVSEDLTNEIKYWPGVRRNFAPTLS